MALHLTSILITPFQQSSSQLLPQSNGLTQSKLLWMVEPPQICYYRHAHTYREMWSLISVLSGRIRQKPISSAPVTSSGTAWAPPAHKKIPVHTIKQHLRSNTDSLTHTCQIENTQSSLLRFLYVGLNYILVVHSVKHIGKELKGQKGPKNRLNPYHSIKDDQCHCCNQRLPTTNI